MKISRLRGALCAGLLVASALLPAYATEQSSTVMPTTGPMSMSDFVGHLNPALRALQGCNWGPSPPANGPGSAASTFQAWCDTSASPSIGVKIYDGTSWVLQGILNTSTHTWSDGSSAAAIQASAYGVICDSVTPIDTPLRNAVAASIAAGGVPVQMPSGTGRCRLTSNIFVNSIVPYTGLLPTAPGIRIVGPGLGWESTVIDSEVANGYAFSVNPDDQAAVQALSGITTTNSGGSLATNTYNVQLSLTDGTGEIYTTLPKTIAVTGASGKVTVVIPPLNAGYTTNIYISTTLNGSGNADHYATVGGVDAVGLAGNQTVNITAVGGAHTMAMTRVFAFSKSGFSNLTISNVTAAANASAINFFRVANWSLNNVLLTGQTKDGFVLPVYLGDVDSSFVGSITNSKFDTIAGWCVKIGGVTSEISQTTMIGNVGNKCGTAPANLATNFTLSSITNGGTAVFTTSAPHTLVTNDQIYLASLAGGTFPTLNATFYRVTVTGASTFNLRDINTNALIDTTSLGTYTASSGTEQLSWRPPTLTSTLGGCFMVGGLSTIMLNTGCTLASNIALYAPESSSGDNLTVINFTAENTIGKGIYLGALTNGVFFNYECLTAASIGATVGCMQIGTGLATGGVQNVTIEPSKVRSDIAISNAFELFNGATGSAYRNTIRVRKVQWQNWVGINRFVNVVFDPITGQARFSVSGLNTIILSPSSGFGCSVPLKLAATGEWVTYCVPSAGISLSTGVLSPNTFYYVYLYNSAAPTSPIVGALEVSTTATSSDAAGGYVVKTGDASRVNVGFFNTDGSGNIDVGGIQQSLFPPSGNGIGTRAGSTGALAQYLNASLTGPLAIGTGVATALGANTNTSGGFPTSASPTFSGTFAGTYTLGGTPSVPASGLTGPLLAAQEPAHTGGCTNSAGSLALSCTMGTNFQLGAGVAASFVAGATDYAGFSSICGSASEASCYVPVSAPATLKNFYAVSPTAPSGSETYTFTVRSGAAGSLSDSGITCQISAAAKTCSDLTHTLSVTAGQMVTVKMVASASAATSTGVNFGLTQVTTSP